jgi:chaperonin GroEL (HSP60 family)
MVKCFDEAAQKLNFLTFVSKIQACIQVCPKNPVNFNVDNVRIAKLVGGGLHNSAVVPGMVLRTDAVGTIKHIEKAKVRSLYILSF